MDLHVGAEFLAQPHRQFDNRSPIDVAQQRRSDYPQFRDRLAALIPAESAGQAISIANAVRYGLVSAVLTSDLGAALQLEAGMIRVNAPTSGVDFQARFGGSKESSDGPREQGLAARSFYTESRTVLIVP
ncbi:MAG: aldehyde dehydrogenase family protein [Streptosporangiaceae bacterium]